jgi:hypothetical protein
VTASDQRREHDVVDDLAVPLARLGCPPTGLGVEPVPVDEVAHDEVAA